ncbi:unnamed protein product [Amaranthus hypochondriacus]
MLKHDVVVEEERIDTSQADSISVQATNIERLVWDDHSVSEALVRRMDSIKEGVAVEEVIEKDQHSLGIQETQPSKKNCGSDELIIRKKMKKIMSPRDVAMFLGYYTKPTEEVSQIRCAT